MSVTQTVTDSINRSRDAARAVTPGEVRRAQAPIQSSQSAHPAAAGIQIIDTSVPSTVAPGETVAGTLTVEISEPSFGVGLDLPDRCSLGFTGNQGFNVRTGAAFRGAPGVDLQTECMDAPSQFEETIGRTKITEQSFSVQAPTVTGSYDIELLLSGVDSGLVMDQLFEPVTVERDSDNGNGNGNGSGNGNGNDDAPGNGDDDGILSRIFGVLEQVVRTVGTGFETIGEAIRTVGGVLGNAIDSIRELLVAAGSAAREVATRAATFVAERPLLIFLIIGAAFGVAPALGEALLSFTPVGVAREILPFVG